MKESLHADTIATEVETQQKDPRSALIDNKIEYTWGSSVGEKGYGDTNEVAHRLYDSLYDPEHALANIEQRRLAENPDLIEQPQLLDFVRDAVEAPLEIEGDVPTREEFVSTISEQILPRNGI